MPAESIRRLSLPHDPAADELRPGASMLDYVPREGRAKLAWALAHLSRSDRFPRMLLSPERDDGVSFFRISARLQALHEGTRVSEERERRRTSGRRRLPDHTSAADRAEGRVRREAAVGLHPDLRDAHLITLPFHRPLVGSLVRLAASLSRAPLTAGVEIVDDRRTGVRIYSPTTGRALGALLWMHGGGFITGAPNQNDRLCSQMARRASVVVVSVRYRLAPRHPFPAALEDCAAAWRFVVGSCTQWGFDASRICIGGESAGGGLAACLAQKIHDTGGVQPLGQLLMYPMLDDRTAARRELDEPPRLVWTNRSNRYAWSAYLGRVAGDREPPEYAVASRRRDLSGLPATWLGVGTLDLFHLECREYARRLETADVPCTFVEVPGAPHGFASIAPGAQISSAFTADQVEFVRSLLQE